MGDSLPLVVNERLAIQRAELEVRATRAGGPGGQHVNTSSTRVELMWDFERSATISGDMRDRIRAKLASRLDSEGRVRIVASDRRSQRQNRAAAEERLVEAVRRALITPRPRRPTKPTRAAKQRRLSEKKLHSQRKRNRRWVED